MSQRAALAAMDADLHVAFAGAGLADVGLYTPPASPAEPPPEGSPEPPPALPPELPLLAYVYVDRDQLTAGDLRQVTAGRVEVSYVLYEGFRPQQHGVLEVDGDRYENASLISDDGSLSRWLVRRARA